MAPMSGRQAMTLLVIGMVTASAATITGGALLLRGVNLGGVVPASVSEFVEPGRSTTTTLDPRRPGGRWDPTGMPQSTVDTLPELEEQPTSTSPPPSPVQQVLLTTRTQPPAPLSSGQAPTTGRPPETTTTGTVPPRGGAVVEPVTPPVPTTIQAPITTATAPPTTTTEEPTTTTEEPTTTTEEPTATTTVAPEPEPTVPEPSLPPPASMVLSTVRGVAKGLA